MKTKMMLSNDTGESIMVDECEVKKCTFTDTWSTIIIVKKEDEEKAISIIDGIEYGDEAKDMLSSEGVECIEIPTDALFIEPEKGTLAVVFAEDGIEMVGKDPYYWDYEYFLYKYWDGSNYKNQTFQKAEEVEISDTIVVKDEKVNHGRAINYYVAKNNNEKVFIFEENSGYYSPAALTDFGSVDEVLEHIEDMKGGL